MTVADPARAIPILASLDLAETQRFYREQLGFAGELWADYAILRRDAMELHFWLARDRIHPEHTACYIRGGQVPSLHEEFSARGVPGLSAFEVKPWGMKEFHLIDPHGNLLRFGCAPQEIHQQPAGAARMFVAANRFRVIPDQAEAFEHTWLSRESRLHEVPGFITFHLLKGPQAEDHILYSSFTLWASREAFEGWTRSDQFRRAHAGAGSSKPVTLGPPQFEGFEVLQTIGAPAHQGA